MNRIDEISEEEDDQEEIQYLNGQSRPTYYCSNFAPAYRGNQGLQKPSNQNQGMQRKPPYIGERSDSHTSRYQPPQQSHARPQQNFQVQPAAASPTPPPDSSTNKLLQQILARHQRLDNMHNHLNVKLDGITNHVGTLERNLEAITFHVRKLDTQVAQIAEAVKRSTGDLPGKPEPNPRGREFVNSVTQSHGESSAQCNTLKAQNQSLEEDNVADATTALGDLNIARGASSSRGGEPSTEQEEPTTLDHQLITSNRDRRFREMMSCMPSGTTFDEAWDSYSLKDVFVGTYPTKEQIAEMDPLCKLPNYHHSEDDDWPLTPLK